MNASGDRIRAIQGHTLDHFVISELYAKIITLEEFMNHPKWAGRGVPDHLVLEISNESHLDQWRRLGAFPPSQRYRFHTMKAVCGTGKQELGPKNIILYAFINTEAPFNIITSIDIYIAGNGRIVTKFSSPASLVTKVRRNAAEGTGISNAIQAPNPPAPAGPPRIRSRDSKGGPPAPMGSNYTDLPLPDRKTVTKVGEELKSGHMNTLPRMTEGNPWEQHRQLQMLQGVFKKVRCDHEFRSRGCLKGDLRVFRHHDDNPAAIANEVNPLRFRVYAKLFNDGFTFSLQFLCEIGKITEAERDAALDSRARHLERVNEQALNEQAARAQRPRMHDNSRSPGSIPSDRDSIAPDPQRRAPENYDDLLRLSKGKGRGDGSTKMEVDA